jgi:hypothetical protein
MRNQVQKGFANMPGRYFLNFDETFGETILRAVDPKMEHADEKDTNSDWVQARNKAGVPKWVVTMSSKKEVFGNAKYEDFQITVTSPSRPCGNITLYTPVTVEPIEMGIMSRDRGGHTVFYSAAAEAIQPLKAAQFAQPGQPPRVAPSQPQQPTRAASGQ